MSREDYLFLRADWFALEQHQRTQMINQVEGIDADRMLNTAVEDLAKYFEAEFFIEVPLLVRENTEVDQKEAQIDVRNDPMRMIRDRSRPALVAGTKIDVEVPFVGDPALFDIRPTSYTLNSPRAKIRGSSVVFSIQGTNLSSEAVRDEIDSTITAIESYLESLRVNASAFNCQLLPEARKLIESRRQKLLASRNLVASLGYRIKLRPGQQSTYAAPEVRRRIVPKMPSASSAPYAPEPTLSDKHYEHILTVMENMTYVMERSPSAFTSVDEEALRSHFLVQLNGHFEGEATGETFNYEGKTDILIRSEGKNIFIAECKFWGGQKKLSDTIDQLLSYSSWRDTKTAVVIFNRNKDFSRVLEAITESVRCHPQYKRDLPGWKETSFKFMFAHRDDSNRELQLSVLAFDVPTKEGNDA